MGAKMLLRVNDVVKYFGGLRVLEKVNMSVEEGKITALIGPNGAGKTTLFNIIAGVYNVNEGSVYFNEKRIDGLPPHKIVKEGIARTFQITKLFPKMTVLENVMVGRHIHTAANSLLPIILNLPRARREEARVYEYAREILKLSRIEKHALEQAGNLPQGKQRLLEMARALATGPKLLLLDEPAAGLNFQEEDVLKEVLALIIKSGISILLVEHDMRVVMEISDWVNVLDLGQLIAAGTPDEIGKNPKVVKAYLGREVSRATA
jgi:branched-chain amino acid transport system ATP-binding protein